MHNHDGGGGGGSQIVGPCILRADKMQALGRAIICICIDTWHMTKSLFIPEQERIMSINWKVYISLSFSLNMRS